MHSECHFCELSVLAARRKRAANIESHLDCATRFAPEGQRNERGFESQLFQLMLTSRAGSRWEQLQSMLPRT